MQAGMMISPPSWKLCLVVFVVVVVLGGGMWRVRLLVGWSGEEDRPLGWCVGRTW